MATLIQRLAGAGIDFVIACQAAIVAEPSERTLHDPAPRENCEAHLALRFAYDIQRDVRDLLRPLDQFASVDAIGPHSLQPRKAIFQIIQYQPSAVAILYIRACHSYRQQEPKDVHYDMALTTLGPLRSIVASIAPF